MISIVMAYYNRLPQLRYTLTTFKKSLSKNFEIVIVDDYSSKEHSIDSIPSEFPSLNFKIIKMQTINSKKSYVGPSIPYNIGFRASKGDKIIIQNPECCHMGDVISYSENNLSDDVYLSFHCFASGKRELTDLHKNNYLDVTTSAGRWYNHSVHRPASYHFTTAITRKNLIELNGFDERYAAGFNYDDDEFIQRIKKKELPIQFVDEPWVVHQYHGKGFNNPLNPVATQDNAVFHNENIKNLSIRANNKEDIK
jgi:GT2 family glycosyltransferase